MNEELKDKIIKLSLIYIVISALITIPVSCGRAVQAFYHQVIVKDQIVGQPRIY